MSNCQHEWQVAGIKEEPKYFLDYSGSCVAGYYVKKTPMIFCTKCGDTKAA